MKTANIFGRPAQILTTHWTHITIMHRNFILYYVTNTSWCFHSKSGIELVTFRLVAQWLNQLPYLANYNLRENNTQIQSTPEYTERQVLSHQHPTALKIVHTRQGIRIFRNTHNLAYKFVFWIFSREEIGSACSAEKMGILSSVKEGTKPNL